MTLDRKDKLIRLKAKNKGNKLLTDAIDDLIKTIESKQWKTKEDVKADRPDADQVHSDGFYFFDINVHPSIRFRVIVQELYEFIGLDGYSAFDKFGGFSVCDFYDHALREYFFICHITLVR